MADSVYSYTKTPVSINALTYEIETSAIATPLDYMNVFGAALDIYFTDVLSGGDQTLLNNIVTAHAGVNLPEDFVEVAATTSTNTNSGAYTSLNGISYSKLRTGTYLVQFTGTFKTNVPLLSTPGLYISIFVNGSQVSTSEMSQDNTTANAPFNISTSSTVVLSDDYQTIEIRWKNNGMNNTISCTTRVLDITKVS